MDGSAAPTGPVMNASAPTAWLGQAPEVVTDMATPSEPSAGTILSVPITGPVAGLAVATSFASNTEPATTAAAKAADNT